MIDELSINITTYLHEILLDRILWISQVLGISQCVTKSRKLCPNELIFTFHNIPEDVMPFRASFDAI
jgi:hypothetical protein